MQKVTTQDMIALLNEIGEQVVVAMVERGDGEERDPAMDMLARKVQIINAIAERVNEMTAVEYLEAREKMPMMEATKAIFAVGKDNRRAVEIVKRWKEEQDGQSCTGKNS